MAKKYTEAVNTTLYNISPQQMNKLNQLALELTGKRSVSALVRHIADYGHLGIELYNQSDIRNALIVPEKKIEQSQSDKG